MILHINYTSIIKFLKLGFSNYYYSLRTEYLKYLLCKNPDIWWSYISRYCHPHLSNSCPMAIPSSLLATTALVQALCTSHHNNSCPSSNPFCPPNSDINQCLKFITSFTYQDLQQLLKLLSWACDLLLHSWHWGWGVLPLQTYTHRSRTESPHAGMRSGNNTQLPFHSLSFFLPLSYT